jgi:hypothetical protein
MGALRHALAALVLATSAAAFTSPATHGVMSRYCSGQPAVCGMLRRPGGALLRRSDAGAGVPRMQEDASEGGYTRKQILREEIEAPFRKVRLFLVPASFASAALAAFISATRLVATMSGVKGYDFNDTANNLGLDIVAMIGLGLIWKRDIDGRNRDLERIARSGRLADLQVTGGAELASPARACPRAHRAARAPHAPHVP